MKPNVDSIVAIMRGFESGKKEFEAARIKSIRESDIVNEGPAFDTAFESAKFLSYKKPVTGLIQLAQLLHKMNK